VGAQVPPPSELELRPASSREVAATKLQMLRGTDETHRQGMNAESEVHTGNAIYAVHFGYTNSFAAQEDGEQASKAGALPANAFDVTSRDPLSHETTVSVEPSSSSLAFAE